MRGQSQGREPAHDAPDDGSQSTRRGRRHFFRSPIKRLIDSRGLVEQLINRVETRVGSLGACAYAGRHILKVLFDTSSGLAIQVGLPRLSARPTVEDVSGRRQEGVIPDTTSIGGLDEPLDY